MNLAVLGNDLACFVDQDGGVEAVLTLSFGITHVKPDAEITRGIKQRLGIGAGHGELVIAVELFLILDQPAREKRGERQFREHHEITAPTSGLAHQINHARHGRCL